MAKTFQRKAGPEVTAEQVTIWTEVETPAGQQTVRPGDWIVTDGAGARTVLSAAEFTEQYAAATVVAPEESGQLGRSPGAVESTPVFPREVEAAEVETPPAAVETPTPAVETPAPPLSDTVPTTESGGL